MVAGASVATGMIAAGLVSDVSEESAIGAILLQPAVVSVPIAFASMIALSLREKPQGVGAAMAALHVPEAVSPETGRGPRPTDHSV
jgi:preprotein translocase subunit Sec61beta